MIESSWSKSSASSRYATTTRRAMGGSYGDLEEADEGSKRVMREIYNTSRSVHRRPKGWIVFLVAVPFILIFSIHAAMSWASPADTNKFSAPPPIIELSTSMSAPQDLYPSSDHLGNTPWSNLTHLIIVAGHTVFTGNDFAGDADKANRAVPNPSQDDFSLEPMQRDQLSQFVGQMKEGVRLAADDRRSMLMFSGGMTRIHAGPRSEAVSYWLYSDAHDWYGYFNGKREARGGWNGDDRSRAVTEEFSRDSFENVLFSVCRFRQLSTRYPEKITVVSLPFKGPRFTELHARALRFPADRFRFVGVGSTSDEQVEGERKHAYSHFLSDPMGCQGHLADKKRGRNPFRRSVPFPKGCPELQGLFSHCGKEVFEGALPWDNLGQRGS